MFSNDCTKRILPPADSKISLFTANCMIIVSLSSNYYVEGVVTEIIDVLNGIFVLINQGTKSNSVYVNKVSIAYIPA